MEEVVFTCLYCNFSWDDSYFNAMYSNNKKCRRCGDTNIKLKKLDRSQKIDYYAINAPKKKIDKIE